MTEDIGDTAIVNEPRVANTDLSDQIVLAMLREPLDKVKCVRLFDNSYRCNWWAPAGAVVETQRAFAWGVAATHHVRKSRFLNAKMVEGKLVITEPSQRGR